MSKTPSADTQKPAVLAKAQITALEQLAMPNSDGLNLLFSKPELFTVGATFMELVALGYAKRKKLNSGWCKFKITRKGRDKWSEVQREQTTQS